MQPGVASGGGLLAANNLSDVAALETAFKNVSQGTTTNDSAGAGFLGEYMSQSIAYASRITGVASNTPVNIASLALTKGDWDVEGVAVLSLNTASLTTADAGISTTGGALGALGSYVQFNLNTTLMSYQFFLPTPRTRISLAANTTVYLIGVGVYSAGNFDAFGFIRARRVR